MTAKKIKAHTLVASNFASGQLLVGPVGPAGTGNACTAGYSSSNPSGQVTLAQYVSVSTTWSDIASCNITLTGTHKVLIVGQFTAEASVNAGDVFSSVLVDGNVVDGDYWANASAKTPGAGEGRVTMPVSTVVTLGPGTHAVTMQGVYYDGGASETVTTHASALSAVDLG